MVIKSIDRFNRKGMLLADYSLRTIVAVLGILILLFLIVGLYASFNEQRKIDQAKSVVEYLKREHITFLYNSQTEKRTDFPLVLPEDWKVVVYHNVNMDGCVVNQIPSVNCLCVCEPEGGMLWWQKDQITACREKGYCEFVNHNVELNGVRDEEGLEIGGGWSIVKDSSGASVKFVIDKK